MPKEEENVHTVSRAQWLQMAVGISVTIVFGLVSYIVSLLNSQLTDAVRILQTSDRVLYERLTELEKQSSYTAARREINNRRFEQLEATVKSQWQEINALKAKR